MALHIFTTMGLSASAETGAESCPAPGILIFTSSLQLLYMNQEARELSEQIFHMRSPQAATGVLPREILKVAEDLQNTLATRRSSKDLEKVRLTRLIRNAKRAVLLFALGIPPPEGIKKPFLLLIIMMEIRHWNEAISQEVSDRFHLTDRERAVLPPLLRGLTNRAIATELGIPHHKVKQDIQRIKQKTNTTNRMEILSQILFEDPGHSFSPPSLD